jgi:lysophospholipase L1-like esterase
MPPLILSLFSWLAFPVYIFQGLLVRQRALRLSPATGPRSGQFGPGDAPYKILTIGDSSAAAVGIEKTSGALCCHLSEKLHARSGKSVEWHISGHNSAVAGEIRDVVVPNLEPVDYTHIIIMLGTNDIKNWHTTGRWKKEFGGLLYALRTRFPESKLYWHQAIDTRSVPALPEPLATIMNWRRALINRKGAQLCVERGAVAVPPLPDVTADGFCVDGFHANEQGYDVWAEHILNHFEHTPRSTPAAAPFI